MSRPVASLISRFDWVLSGLVLLLSAVGLINLYSSSVALNDSLYLSQGVWLLLGFVLATLTVVVDYRNYERWSYFIYGAVLLMLVAVFGVGSTINNSRRWLNLGFFYLQPSELMKLAIIICGARYFSDHPKAQGYTVKDLIAPLGLLAVPAALIMKQPDLGTSLVVCFIFATMILFLGVRLKSFLFFFSTGVLAAPMLWFFGLHDYQKSRITSFMDLEKDSFGAGWQVLQSLIAFGAGGLTGRGYLQGTQVQKGFVPYHESDFAAVNWAEEHGFIGMLVMLVLYFSLIVWSLKIAQESRDRFGMLIAVGVAALIFWHVVINLGMVLGMLPVVGLTLPFVSYGGSSLLTMMIAVGLLMNVSVRRHIF